MTKMTNDIYEVMGRFFNPSEFINLHAGENLADALREEYLGFTSAPEAADKIDWQDIANQCRRQGE